MPFREQVFSASSSPVPNAAEATAPHTPDVRRFAGQDGGLGSMLGFEDTRVLRAVRAAGNYAAI
jgi:general L-amino acid transport system substrate-binding protein